MALYSTVALRQRTQDVTADFRLKAGETAMFVFGGVREKDRTPGNGVC